MKMTYDQMLDRAYLSIPQKALSHERFEIPKADSFIQGTKTIVKGANDLVKTMRRDKKHFLKFLMKETALPVSEGNNQITINGKIGAISLNKLIDTYFRQFILCHECGKPDTHIETREGVHIMKCEACGAIKPVRDI